MRREYNGEAARYAERDERPDKNNSTGRPRDCRREPVVPVDERHGQRGEPAKEHDDVSGSPIGEQQGSTRDEEEDRDHHDCETGPAAVKPEDDITSDVKRQEDDREQGYNSQGVGFH